MKNAYCYFCGWKGPIEELDFNERDEEEYCPVCGKSIYPAKEYSRPIGNYAICNTGSVNIYAFDDTGDNVLAGINDSKPEEYRCCCDEDDRYGFYLGEMFIPFCETTRYYDV